MLPILICSVVAMAIVLERFWSLQRRRVTPDNLVAQVWQWARSGVLDEIEPQGIAVMNPYEIEKQGLEAGQMVAVETRRGTVEAVLRSDREVADGMIFMPFCFNESPANRLTNPMLDPYGKIPDFKFCAAKVGRMAVSEAAE